ncbi:MAG: NAD-dependent epimerase/dehydratase family protein [Candidatus Aminicenantes bacterium]|nr:NAD-dependent epimerase/dehydratase family protein [Candidatus Aminicenantes bacterium]
MITGASGLLGRALVEELSGAGYRVLAHYRRRPGAGREGVLWLKGDFSSVEGTAAFLEEHRAALRDCRHVVHSYGPILEKATVDVTGSDLVNAFGQQLQPALDITRFLLAGGGLRSALFIAFEDTGRVRPYAKVLAFAMAKNSLLLLSRSLAAVHPGVRFNVFSPPTLAGAAVRHPTIGPVAAAEVAAKVRRILRGRGTGRHYRWTAPGREPISGRKA